MHLTLVSILFSYMYDARTTGHEPTSESAWTIAALTPCFAALVQQPTLRETVVASYRRALCWPLYRSWKLCERVKGDVVSLLERGTKAVLRALLETNKILAGHDVYYVYSKVWVEDYCVWVARRSTFVAHSVSFARVVLTLLAERRRLVLLPKSSRISTWRRTSSAGICMT